MPCYEVRLASVEFKAQHVELLLKALDRLQLRYDYKPRYSTIQIIGSRLLIDLSADQAFYREGAEREQSLLNAIKRTYAAVAIETAAAKKKWFVKKLADNQLALRRA